MPAPHAASCAGPRPARPLRCWQRWGGPITLLAWLLVGCASGPQRPSGGSPGSGLPRTTPPADSSRDGPEAHPPADLHQVPDAQPRLEAVRPGGPNKPYEVLGQRYTPLPGDPPLVERGLASWYGRKFHGRNTATGEVYNMYAMTAAHKTMPLPSYARVRNPANGREVVVRVNDRGPFHSDRVIDLSYTAALKLGLLGGVAPVEVERITYEAIRSEAWRLPAGSAQQLAQAEPVVAPLPLPAEPGTDPISEIALRAQQRVADRPAAANSAPGFWLQLGAFSQRDGAVGFQQRVLREADWLAPLLAIFNERSLHRLQAGPYASRADAASAAERLRAALQLVPAIVERR